MSQEALTDLQLAMETLRKMPSEATLQEIGEEIAILVALREAEADSAAGRSISHEELKRRSAAWSTRSGG